MLHEYQHLGPFADWVPAARKAQEFQSANLMHQTTRQQVKLALDFQVQDNGPQDVRIEATWESEGLLGEEVSWWVGYGPRTHAYVLKPADSKGQLPGILALHSHDNFKYFGKEKIADGPSGAPPDVSTIRYEQYDGRAFANDLARTGFVVLVPDAFSWGSRKFPLECMPDQIHRHARAIQHSVASEGVSADVALYNSAAFYHENVLEKYCRLLGTTLAAVVGSEDRAAAAYLASRSDVDADHIGSIGLSGGGCRSVLLQATSDNIVAAVVVAMMTTYEALLDHNVADHTWMFFPDSWAPHSDWPDLAGSRAPFPLLVQYNRDDPLFTMAGMEAAHDRITARYRETDRPSAYTGQFYYGPHKFDRVMQTAAFEWLAKQLRSNAIPDRVAI